jgi:signal transduction histidine kinase
MKFQTKLFIAFAAVIAAAIGLQIALTLRFERVMASMVESDLRDLSKTVHFSSRLLSTESGPDREALAEFIESLKRNKSVREISVVSSSNEVVGSSNPEKVGTRHVISGNELVVREQFGIRDSTGRHLQYDIRIPLIKDGRVIGLVHTTFMASDTRYLIRQNFYRHLILSAATLLLSFGIFVGLVNHFNRPLRQLIQAAEKVAAGDLSPQVLVSGRDELVILARTFNTMTHKISEQRQLEETIRTLERRVILSEIASTIAHEIRNPLNLINLTIDHLGHQLIGMTPEQSRMMESLKAEVQHLNRIVADFINLGQPTRLKKARFIVGELVDQCQLLVRQQLADKRIEFGVAGPRDAVLDGDVDQLRLVLLNLLINAIQMSPVGGAVTVTIETAVRSINIIVADNGPGLADEDLPRLFEPYYSRRPGGTGLGLTLARRIVEEHGGTISAGNDTNGGARFTITLPVEDRL